MYPFFNFNVYGTTFYYAKLVRNNLLSNLHDSRLSNVKKRRGHRVVAVTGSILGRLKVSF